MVMTIIAVGIVVLVVFAAMVGTSMDTERRRARWRWVAEQRRLQAEQRRESLPEGTTDSHGNRPELSIHPSRTAG
jgi:hypothetical protein